jgi:hypothetical protein
MDTLLSDETDEVYSLVLISDLNSSYGSTDYEPEVHEVIRLITTEWQPDAVLVGGDLIAGQRASLSDENVLAMWEAFDDAIYNPIRGAEIAFGFTPGNHDASGYPAHERDRQFALDHWAGRDLGFQILDSLDFPLNYSFRAGPVFVVSWDASTEFGPHEEHVLSWLERQFDRTEATAAAERWVLGHLPVFGVAVGRNQRGEVLTDPDSLLARFSRWNVDAYLSGHQHAYYPAHRDAIDYLHLGALGQGARQLVGSDREPVQTVTRVRFGPDGRRVETYEVHGSTLERLDPAVLPDSIVSVNGTVRRMAR